jgi:hypothetical protein
MSLNWNWKNGADRETWRRRLERRAEHAKRKMGRQPQRKRGIAAPNTAEILGYSCLTGTRTTFSTFRLATVPAGRMWLSRAISRVVIASVSTAA